MKNTRTLAVIGIALAGVVGLSACTSGTTPEAASTPSHSASPVQPLDREAPSLSDNADLTEGESLFILGIEDYDQIDYTATEEADIALAGTMVCADLADGIDPMTEALDISEALGVTEFEGGYVVGLAASTICPEFADLVMDSANAAIDGGYDTFA